LQENWHEKVYLFYTTHILRNKPDWKEDKKPILTPAKIKKQFELNEEEQDWLEKYEYYYKFKKHKSDDICLL
jgi:hypothetical protein